MTDIFDNIILCKNCSIKMQKAKIVKNGFLLRALICSRCGDKIMHPADEAEYNKFRNLRNKEFHVKMRLVGNSYAVSIPKEIVSFIKEQEKIMNDMVRLCFEDFGRLSLDFNRVKSQTAEVLTPLSKSQIKENRHVAEIKKTHQSVGELIKKEND